jgi:autophagy-related protein 18
VQKVTRNLYILCHSIDGIHRILVATSDGTLYVGNIDPRDGGECRITKEFRLFGPSGNILQEEENPSNVS